MRFKNFSIKRKLIAIILGIVTIMLLLGFLVLGNISIKIISDIKISEAATLSKIIGEYSITALDFNYPERGKEILSKLKNDENMVACFLYDKKGQSFSSYISGKYEGAVPPDITTDTEFQLLKNNHFHLLNRIYYNDNFYGWIYIIVDSEILATSVIIFLIFSGLFFVLLIFSYLLAYKLQRYISQPILKLAGTAEEISSSGNYSIKIQKEANDEIGKLYEEFNKMLIVIHKREQEKNQAQEEVRQREQWIQTIINNLNDAVIVHDIDTGKIIYTNQTAARLYGYEQSELYNVRIGDISRNDRIFSQERALRMIKKCCKEGPQIFHWHARKKDGTLFWVEINMRKTVLNNCERIMVVIRDIDDQKKNQQALQNLQRYLIDIIDSMPSIIIGTDEKIRVTQWNRQAERFTALKAPAVMGKKLDDLTTNLPSHLPEKINQSISNEEVIVLEKFAINIDNIKYYFNITIYPLTASGSEGAVIRLDNVTEKIQMEEMMIQSEKMLSVGGLAAGMAHEINNPLAGMMQNASVILNRLTKSSDKNIKAARDCGTSMDAINSFMAQRNIIKQLQLIYDSGKRASDIISNMLSFSRKSESRFLETNITEVMDLSIKLAENDYDLKKKFDFRKITIKKDYQENLPLCKCDKSKISQVFLNLLKNGAHAMSEIKDRESVFYIRIYQKHNYLTIEIEDNGPGIPENIRNRIFEPFFTTKDIGQGTGLGLSVSYFIITDNHRGNMYVESNPGSGTKFIIKLPVSCDEN